MTQIVTHWDILELAPTGDALAIKRAYARLLKLNRPDEFPDAYQALRQAYEWALSEAEWLRQTANIDTPEIEAENSVSEQVKFADENTPPPISFDGAYATDLAMEAVESDPIKYDSAQALLDRWAEPLQALDQRSAEICWQTLKYELDALPLIEHMPASALFAEFVLAHDSLHPAWLAKLTQYFQWGRDYRDAAWLGTSQLALLRDRLQHDVPTEFCDAQLEARAVELRRLEWVIEQRGEWFGKLYAALARPGLRALATQFSDEQRKMLGISWSCWNVMEMAALQAIFTRLLLVLACVSPIVALLAKPGQNVSGWLVVAGMAGVMFWAVAWWIAMHLPLVDYLQGKLLGLRVLRSDRARIAAAIVAPIAVALVAGGGKALPALPTSIPMVWLASIGVLVCCLALLLSWPDTLEERVVYLPMLGVFTIALTHFTQGNSMIAFAAASAWMGLAAWVYRQYHEQILRFYANPWALLRPRAWWGWVLLVAAFKFVLAVLAIGMVLALPITLRVYARYFSANAGLLAMWLAVSLALLVEADKSPGLFLPVLALSAAALTWLQALASWVSGKVFADVRPGGGL